MLLQLWVYQVSLPAGRPAASEREWHAGWPACGGVIMHTLEDARWCVYTYMCTSVHACVCIYVCMYVWLMYSI